MTRSPGPDFPKEIVLTEAYSMLPKGIVIINHSPDLDPVAVERKIKSIPHTGIFIFIIGRKKGVQKMGNVKKLR